LVSIGIGIGAGIFIRDNIYRGETGLAGELGHIIVTESITPRCSCGNFGCLETISSGRGIVEQTKKSIKDGVNTSLKKMVNNDLSKLTVKLINEAAEKGDKLSYQILDKAGDYIGRGITTMLNLFGPKLVIIGSGISNCGNILFDAIRRSIKIRTLEHISKQVEIIKTKLDDNASAQGAVIFMIDEIFNSKLLFELRQ
ncbi:MAG: ROK family protein, partial [Actinobacteria bacterium]|nr:ROK family protein [Actinomycetota bacterium]